MGSYPRTGLQGRLGWTVGSRLLGRLQYTVGEKPQIESGAGHREPGSLPIMLVFRATRRITSQLPGAVELLSRARACGSQGSRTAGRMPSRELFH
jgi:hypothetical protein